MDPRGRLIIEYARPPQQVRGNGLWARVIGGVSAGGVTYASTLMFGMWGLVLSAIACGFIVGFVSARQAVSRVVLAGVFGNFTALVAFACLMILSTVIRGENLAPLLGGGELGAVAFLLAILFGIPGLVGGIWVWEGRNTDM